jgi:hypothetical protein
MTPASRNKGASPEKPSVTEPMGKVIPFAVLGVAVVVLVVILPPLLMLFAVIAFFWALEELDV